MLSLQRVTFWIFVALFYFSEGLPYGLINNLLPIYLREEDVSRTQITFVLSLVGTAWTLKLFWAPLVDKFGTYQRWITGALLIITASMIPFATADLAHSHLLWILLTVMVIASATQDIAVDAYTIAATPRERVGPVNAIRITAYRLGLIFAGGGLAIVATRAGWPAAFATATALSGVLLFASFWLPPQQQIRAERQSIIAGLREWLNRPQAGAVLAVAFLYKLGDSALTPMIPIFWIDRGYSAQETGTVITVFGVSFMIVGAWLGGALIHRYGVYWALLWLGIVQMLSNVGYAVAASSGGDRPLMYTAALFEAFSNGMGTAAYLAFFMSICDRTRAATEFALLTGLYSLSRQLVATPSGLLTDLLGYPIYFWITVILGIPGLLFLPKIRERMALRAE